MLGRGGFFRAFKTKTEADDVARELRKPSGAKRHGLGYPVTVTVKRAKDPFNKGKIRWAVYVYRK